MRVRRGFRQACYVLAVSLLISSTTQAVLVNRTIDDTNGDSESGQKPTYLPSGSVWQGSCGDCAFQTDPTLAFDHTWTAATFNPSLQNINITLRFTGVSIWVFFILPEARAFDKVTGTACNITLDGQHSGGFVNSPQILNNIVTPLQYNVTVFNAPALTNAEHELIISTSDLPYNVFLNFDYAIYTVDLPDNATSTTSTTAQSTASLVSVGSPVPAVQPFHPSSHLGIIIGCAFGGVALILLVSFALVFWYLRKARIDHALMAQKIVARNHQPTEGIFDDVFESHIPLQSPIYAYSDLSSQSTTVSNLSYDRSPSSTDLRSAPLVPVRLHDSRNELVARQMNINQHLPSAQFEMSTLTARQTAPPSSSGDSGRQEETEPEMVSIREEIRQLRAQMANLQTEQQSDWALGLSDEPPPAYT